METKPTFGKRVHLLRAGNILTANKRYQFLHRVFVVILCSNAIKVQWCLTCIFIHHSVKQFSCQASDKSYYSKHDDIRLPAHETSKPT